MCEHTVSYVKMGKNQDNETHLCDSKFIIRRRTDKYTGLHYWVVTDFVPHNCTNGTITKTTSQKVSGRRKSQFTSHQL